MQKRKALSEQKENHCCCIRAWREESSYLVSISSPTPLTSWLSAFTNQPDDRLDATRPSHIVNLTSHQNVGFWWAICLDDIILGSFCMNDHLTGYHSLWIFRASLGLTWLDLTWLHNSPKKILFHKPIDILSEGKTTAAQVTERLTLVTISPSWYTKSLPPSTDSFLK